MNECNIVEINNASQPMARAILIAGLILSLSEFTSVNSIVWLVVSLMQTSLSDLSTKWFVREPH